MKTIFLRDYTQVINKHPDNATILLYLDNPNNYLIEDIEIDGLDVTVVKNNIVAKKRKAESFL